MQNSRLESSKWFSDIDTEPGNKSDRSNEGSEIVIIILVVVEPVMGGICPPNAITNKSQEQNIRQFD